MSRPTRAMFGSTAMALAILLGLTFPKGGHAQPPSPKKDKNDPVGVLEYRRVFVPEGQLLKMTDRYFPVTQEKFDELLRDQRRQAAKSQVPATRILSAEYSARFEKDAFVAGTGTMEISHTAETTGVVSFDECNLPITNATWRPVREGPPPLGVSADGHILGLVEKSGTLQFQWTLQGHPIAVNELEFEVRLPAAPLNRLNLSLPPGMTLASTVGVVTKAKSAVVPPKNKPAGKPTPPAANELLSDQVWQVDLGGQTQTRLRIAAENMANGERGRTRSRQSDSYEITAAELRLRSELRLDIEKLPLRQLVVDVSRELRIVQVTVGEKPLTWEMQNPPGNAEPQMVVEFADPLSGHDRLVRIQAVASSSLKQLSALPSLRPRDMTWNEGNTSVTVREPLAVQEIEVTHGRQTQFNTNLANGGESFLFQHYTHDSHVRLRLQRKTSPVKIASGTTINIDSSTLSGHLLADLQGEYGARFEFDADISSEWVIDDVITIPGEHLDDYDVTPPTANARQRIHIRLRNAVTPQRSVRISIRAHRRSPAENISLNIDQLRMADFHDVRVAKRLLVLNAESNWKAELTSDFGVERVDGQKLSSGEAALITVLPGSIILRDDEAAQRVKVRFRPSRPEFTAHLAVRASVTAQTFVEDYRLNVVPDRTTLDKLLVHFTEPREEPLVWMLEGPVVPALAARRLGTSEAVSLGLQNGEVWELTMRSPRGSEFQIRATRSSPVPEDETQPLAVSLVSLPQATLQTGTVEVSATGIPLTVQSEGMSHVPSPPAPAHEINPQVDALRYDPGQNRRVSIKRVLTGENGSPLTAWAWSCDVISHLGQPDRYAYEAIYRLENAGAKDIAFELVDGLKVDRALVEGIETSIATSYKLLRIALPSNVRFPTVVLHYSSPALPPRFVNRVPIALPIAKFPVLQQRWTVWMPAEMVAQSDNAILPRLADSSDWPVRLFGPLWRRGSNTAAPRFGSLSSFGFYDRQDEQLRALEILVNFGQAASTVLSAAKTDENPVRWRQIASVYGTQTVPSAPNATPREDGTALPTMPPQTLLLDSVPLAELGIFADTEIHGIAPRSGESAAQFADRFLKHFGLAVIVDGQQPILTSAVRLALLNADLATSEERTLAFLRRGENPRISLLSAQDCWNSKAWEGAGKLPRSPWRIQKSSIASDLAYSSWHACEVPFSGSSEGAITVYRMNAIQTLATGVMFTALAVAVWFCRRKLWRRTLALLLIATALTLVSPVPMIAVFRGLLWGALAGIALAAPRRKVASPAPVASQSTVTKLIISGASRCLLVSFAGGVIGNEMLPYVQGAESAAKPEIAQVLVPIDQENKPTGKYIWLPRDFYHLLSRQASTQKSTPHNWLLVAASYTGTVTADPVSERLDLLELNAVFDLEIFQPGAVTLALGRDKINLLNDRAMLNGQPITVDWDAEGRGITFEAEDVGNARLEIAVRPIVQRFEGLAGFDWKVPRVPAAKLRLRLPTGDEQITVPTAIGGVGVQSTTGTLTAELGPTNLLSVRWPALGSPLDRSRSASVEQMLWLRAKPGSVVLETKLIVTPAQGKPLSTLTLAVDPRLNLLSLRDDPQIVRHEVRDGDPREIRVTLKEGTERPITLQFSFLMVGSSGVGQLAFPYVEVLNAPTTRSWGAISFAPPLLLDSTEAGAADTLETTAFLEAWGKSEYLPHSAYRLSAKSPSLQFPLRYARGRTTGRATMDVLVGRRNVDLRFSADLRTVDGSIFQHQLTVPKGFVPTEVSVTVDDSERLVRWSMSDETSLRLMFNNPLSGDHTLVIRGEVPLPASGIIELNLPRVVSDDFSAREISVYRDEETQVTLHPTPAWEFVKDSKAGQYIEGLGRLVARLQNKLSNGNLEPHFAKLIVAANKTTVRGRMVTIVEHLDQWRTTVECQLHVERGALEVLRFEIPAEWSSSFEIEPAADYTIAKIPGQTRQHLLVRPREALTGDCRVRIRGPLSATAAREHVPEVVPLDLQQVELFIIVPTHVKSQKIEWETSFLQAVPLPEDIASNPSLSDYAAYRVTGMRFRAAIRQVEQQLGDPSVLLADYSVLSRRGNEFTGTAIFDCQPAGRQTCAIEMPDECELIHLYVDGRSPTLTRHNNRDWIVPLGPEQLVQRIELIYRGISRPAANHSDSQTEIPTPNILDWPIHKTVWSIDDINSPRTVDETTASSAGQLQNDEIRLRELFDITRQRGDLAAAHNVDEIREWFKPWRQRLELGRREIQQNLQLTNQFPAAKAISKDLSNRVEKLLTQTADSAAAETGDDTAMLNMVADLWRDSYAEPRRTLRGDSSVPVPALTLPVVGLQPSDLPSRLAHVAIAIALFYVGSRRGVYVRMVSWYRRRSYLVLAIIGLAWWWFLNFAWVGLILTAWGIGGTFLQSLRTKDRSANMLQPFSKK